jgi:hypothetical protein
MRFYVIIGEQDSYLNLNVKNTDFKYRRIWIILFTQFNNYYCSSCEPERLALVSENLNLEIIGIFFL